MNKNERILKFSASWNQEIYHKETKELYHYDKDEIEDFLHDCDLYELIGINEENLGDFNVGRIEGTNPKNWMKTGKLTKFKVTLTWTEYKEIEKECVCIKILLKDNELVLSNGEIADIYSDFIYDVLDRMHKDQSIVLNDFDLLHEGRKSNSVSVISCPSTKKKSTKKK